MGIPCNCACTGNTGCYVQDNVELPAFEILCPNGKTYWFDSNNTNLIIPNSAIVECGAGPVIPPPPTPTATCAPATLVTTESATLNGAGQNVPATHTIRICYGTVLGGPYPNCGPVTVGNAAANQPVSSPVAGLAPGVNHYYVTQVLDAGNAVVATSTECTFITADQDVIVFNFPDGPPASNEVIDCFEQARANLNAGFLTPPVLFNGSTQIVIDMRINNDPPFDGVPGGVVGNAGPTSFRPDGTTATGQGNFEEATFADLDADTCLAIATHELLHALGLGVGPNWDALIVGENTNLWGFTGPQALNEYQAMAGGFPGAAAIPVEWDTGSPGSDGSHWDTVNPDGTPNGYGHACMDNELMSFQVSGSNTFSRVTAAALRDLGYDYDINNGAAFACGGA